MVQNLVHRFYRQVTRLARWRMAGLLLAALRMAPLLLAPVLASALAPVLAPLPAGASPPDFRVLNAMLYKNMPPFGEKQAVVYEQSFFAAGTLADNIRPSAKGIEQAVANARLQRQGRGQLKPGEFIALDLERWPLWPFASQQEHAQSLSHYADSARRFAQNSGAPVCLYGVFPGGGINAASQSVRNKEMGAQWRKANATAASQLEDVVSALCPQLYNYYRFGGANGDTLALEQWKTSASQSLALARELTPGLPVYPFIWPQYHQGGNVKDFAFVDAELWRAQLIHLKSLADGVILWGGYDIGPNKQLAWDDDAPWWKVLREVFPEQTRVAPAGAAAGSADRNPTN